MKLVLLSGGTGTPKLLQGFMEVLEPREISVVVNTGEDKWLPHGYFSPDMDTVMYTLGGVIDEGTWHGIAGDSFFTHHRLRALGGEGIFTHRRPGQGHPHTEGGASKRRLHPGGGHSYHSSRHGHRKQIAAHDQ